MVPNLFFLVAVAGPQMFERATAKIKAAAAEENRQALMLFTVVASFLICNACRVAFKLNEVLNYDKVRITSTRYFNSLYFYQPKARS